jgi:hypothetical protein
MQFFYEVQISNSVLFIYWMLLQWIWGEKLKMEASAGQGTVFAPSLEGMKHVRSDNGEILTKPFLDVCKLILPVIGPFLFFLLFNYYY